MKKVHFILLTLLFLCFSTIANALPTTWEDYIDFNPDILVPPALTYTHDINDDGFLGLADGGDDFITSYMLTVSLYDDNDKQDWVKWEVAVIDQPGGLGDGLYNFNYDNQQFGWSFAGLIQLNLDGELTVSIDSLLGDFYVDASELVAFGDNGTAPVPEPGTMILLGSGLLGLAGIRRKKAK